MALPGYGYAKRSKAEQQRWGDMIQGYFTSDRNIRLVLQLIDMRHKPSQDDFQMLQFLRDTNTPFIIVLTKCDKLNKTDFQKAHSDRADECADYCPAAMVPFSALSKQGVQEVRNFLD